MTPQQFIAKWQAAQLSERSACQQHFLDLCDLLGQPKPAAADPEGAWYTFERGVRKTTGEKGWADVWMRGHFGWEYKGKRKDLRDAYLQLQLYREDLENPPLLVVCDLDRFEIHTNFTDTVAKVYAFDLAGLADPANLDVLRRMFREPQSLRPAITTFTITEDAANRFGELADGMRLRGIAAPQAAHFLMRLMFCMFAEDIRLLPAGLFSQLLKDGQANPASLNRRLGNLFSAMAKGGDFGPVEIAWFNGGLFSDGQVIALTQQEINILVKVNDFDWSSVEPSVFGTLFERTLDPAKRSQIGAHYTSRADILTLLEPVLMTPLRREWAAVKQKCEEKLWPAVEKAGRERGAARGVASRESRQRKAYDRALQDFAERLTAVTVLDPACGSGNFLYVAINLLLDLEKEVIAYAASHGLNLLPHVRPTQLLGLEINPYAQELAQVVIWIGYLQWMHHNGFKTPSHPVLEPIDTIRCMDSIVDPSDPAHPREPDWPKADFIVGNPPFLGGKLLRTNLGDAYVDAMFRVWDDRVPREGDLCCYWFEKARRQLETKNCLRAGLLATQGIRGGANRKVLQQIKASGDIFFAESDREWVLDGAAVHVSMVGFDSGEETVHVLNGQTVEQIHANLTSHSDITRAVALSKNSGVAFQGPVKVGAFDIAPELAVQFLKSVNPHGRPNSDVLFPWVNGADITRRPRTYWMIDFGDLEVGDAAKYEAPFGYVEREIKSERTKNADRQRRMYWWRLGRSGCDWKAASCGLPRTLFTPRVSKHRLVVWFPANTIPDSAVVGVATSSDTTFGVLQSRIHELWALRQGTQLETRPRYTPSTCFETFPFPKPSPKQSDAIAAAAKELDELRTRWLNPPEWTRTEVLEFPGSVNGPWARYVHDADARGIGTVRWPRLVPKDPDCAASLKDRTLTKLYNQRPAWLDLAHQRLDAAVFAAYGWPADLSDEQLLARRLELNLARAAAERE